jgi:hypothetical protein
MSIDSSSDPLNALLARSVDLERGLNEFLGLPTYDGSDRSRVSRAMCAISYEHAESAKVLTATGNFTSAVGLLRLQYEALVRALWIFYAASDASVAKLAVSLSAESAQKAAKLPMVSEMLEKMAGKAPAEALGPLHEFKDHQWKALSSFVHGGLHAIDRHEKGYPVLLLLQLVLSSNGLLVMTGMLLVILHGGGRHQGRIPELYMKFEDCLPPPQGVPMIRRFVKVDGPEGRS